VLVHLNDVDAAISVTYRECHIGKLNDVEQMVLCGKENDEMSTN